MKNTVLFKDSNINKDLVEELAYYFYKKPIAPGYNYRANEMTQLNYFGEYLERHIDRNVSDKDIMAGVAFYYKEDLPEHEMFDGQYELFINRIEEKRSSLDFDFELDIFYYMFLIKMKKEAEGKKVLKEAIDKVDLDERFLIFSELVDKKIIKLEDDIRLSIVDKLNKNKFKLNIDRLVEKIVNNDSFDTLRFKSEYVYLKSIFNIYNLSKRDFKTNANVFECLKSFKKIGTRDGIYNNVKDMLDIAEDEFYLMSLKIAGESYVPGPSLGSTNGVLMSKLENNLTPNNNWYPILQDIQLRYGATIDKRYIDLNKINYSKLDKEYYDSFIKVFGKHYGPYVNYENAKDILKSDTFIGYIKSLKEQSLYVKNLALRVIRQEDDNIVVKQYYEVIKDRDDLNHSDVCTFCKANLVSVDYVLDKIITKDNLIETISYDSRSVIETCIASSLDDILIALIKRLNSSNVNIGNYVIEALKATGLYLEEKIKRGGIEGYDSEDLFSELNNFNFMYISAWYELFVVRNITNDIFKSALSINEDEVREVASYMLNNFYMNDEHKSILKEITLSKGELFKEKLQQELDDYISSYNRSSGAVEPSSSLVKIMSDYDNKEITMSLLKKNLESILSYARYDLNYMGFIKLILKTQLMPIDEVLDLLKDRLSKAI